MRFGSAKMQQRTIVVVALKRQHSGIDSGADVATPRSAKGRPEGGQDDDAGSGSGSRDRVGGGRAPAVVDEERRCPASRSEG